MANNKIDSTDTTNFLPSRAPKGLRSSNNILSTSVRSS